MLHELVIDGTPSGKRHDFAGADIPDFSEHPTKAGRVWLPVVFEDATLVNGQVHADPVVTVENGTVFVRRAARARTAAENRALDLDRLRAALADAVLIEVRLGQWIIANTAMVATDFRPAVRQAFLDLVPIADRLDPP